MNERKTYFGIEKKFWFLISVIGLFVFVSSIPLLLENQTAFDWSFYVIGFVLFAVFLLAGGWAMTKENTSLLARLRTMDLEQEQIDKACRDQLRNFVQRFNPVGETVLEGDFPYLSASFNDQDGKRHEVLMLDDKFYERIS